MSDESGRGTETRLIESIGKRVPWWSWPVLAVSVAAGLAGLWLLVGIVLSSDRGLDVTDEGLYLLAADPPSRTAAWFMPFGWSTAPLFAAVGYDIASFRTAGAVLLMLAGGWLGWSSVRLASGPSTPLRTDHRSFPWLAVAGAACGLIGALLYYESFLRTPSYNWSNLLGILLSSASLLTLMRVLNPGPLSGPRWVAMVLAVVTAFGLFITIPAKPSTAPAVIVMSGCLLSLWLGTRRGLTWMLAIVAMIAGWLAFAVGASWWPMDFMSVFTRALGMPSPDEAHTLTGAFVHVLVGTPWSIAGVLWHSPPGYVVLLVIGLLLQVIALFVARRMRRLRFLGFTVTVIAAWMLPESLGFLALTVATILLLLRSAEFSLREGSTAPIGHLRVWALVAFLLLLPFVYAFGSTNAPLLMTFQSAALFSIAAISAVAGLTSGRTQLAIASVIAGFTIMAVVTTLAAARQDPYRQPPIDTQTVAISVGSRGATLRVDPDLGRLLSSLRHQAEQAGWSDGTPLLGIAWRWSSTVPYALGARPPESLMLTLLGPTPSRLAIAQYSLGPDFGEFPWTEAWLLTTELKNSDESSRKVVGDVIALLEVRTERAFPGDYVCVARAGDLVLWKPGTAGAVTTDVPKGTLNCLTADPEQSNYDFSDGWKR